MLQASCLELRFLWWLGVIKIWLLYKDYMLKFYKLIITTKTNFNCNKACGSKLNLRTHNLVVIKKRLTISVKEWPY